MLSFRYKNFWKFYQRTYIIVSFITTLNELNKMFSIVKRFENNLENKSKSENDNQLNIAAV